MTRKHDLPPKWDGLPVKWSSTWKPEADIIGWEPDPCPQCGRIGRRAYKLGTVYQPEPPHIGVDTHNRHGPAPILTIYVSRCPYCGHDTAVTMDHHSRPPEQCDLDDSDYGDEGSYERSTP